MLYFVMTSSFKNPPIEVFILEAQFPATSKHDQSFFDTYHTLVKADYPKKHIIKHISSNINLDVNNENRSTAQPNIQLAGLRLSSDDDKNFLFINPSTFSFHRVKPYGSWKEHSPEFVKVFKKYRSQMEINPSQIILRYLNLIQLPEESTLSDYFTFGLASPEDKEGDNKLKKIFINYTKKYDDECDYEVVFSPVSIEGMLYFRLDLSIMLEEPKEEFEEGLNKLHKIADNVFRNLITENTRKLFD